MPDWSDEELSSSSSRPNDVGAGDGGGDDGGGADGGGADGGNTGASIGGSTGVVASPTRLSPPATAGVWPMSRGGEQLHVPHMHGGLNPFVLLRGVIRAPVCKVLWHTRVRAGGPRQAPPLSQLLLPLDKLITLPAPDN